MDFMYSLLSDGMDQRPAYGFSHRMRASVEKDEITPSPLDYHAEKVNLGESSRSYTFGHRPRTNYVIDEDLPGPGEYFPVREVPRSRSPGYSFGLKSAPKRRRSQTPGPSYYAQEPAGSFQPQRGFSFGHRPMFGRRFSDTPGPGEYGASEKFLYKDTPAYSFGVKNHMRGRNHFFANETPASADYRPELALKKSSPSYTFGHKSRGHVFVPQDFDIPGVGEYNVGPKRFSNYNKGFSFGSRFPTLIK